VSFKRTDVIFDAFYQFECIFLVKQNAISFEDVNNIFVLSKNNYICVLHTIFVSFCVCVTIGSFVCYFPNNGVPKLVFKAINSSLSWLKPVKTKHRKSP